MAVPPEQSRGAVRFSFGRETTEAEIDEVIGILKRKLIYGK
jgi:cysteine sulfinate desulfinase/cysteine desulfurase-like protein